MSLIRCAMESPALGLYSIESITSGLFHVNLNLSRINRVPEYFIFVLPM
jgi:hypothetical protein